MGDRWDRIPADAFVEILRRLPQSPRRRLRLVCRHWRSVIDDRTPAAQVRRAKVLAFVGGLGRSGAYILDDLTEHGTGGREVKLPRGAAGPRVSMVGTCNGLLCLRRRWCEDLVVVNPVTGEKLAVPPPYEPPRVSPELAAYSFTYHPATGLYKIVHAPCDGAVKVFTLGDRSWREVPVPKSRLVTSFGITSVDGATYWVTADARSVMSLDLKDERVVFVATLPVWMLEDGGRDEKQPAWVLQCKVVEPPQAQGISLPHFTHGEHVLTTRAIGVDWVSLHACCLSAARTRGGVVRTEGSPSIGLYDCYSIRTFAYVETTEALAFYGANDCEIGDSEEWDWRFDGGERRWKLMPHASSSLV